MCRQYCRSGMLVQRLFVPYDGLCVTECEHGPLKQEEYTGLVVDTVYISELNLHNCLAG